MPNVVQWSVDQFWNQLQNLKTQIDQVDAALAADKANLTRMYTYARQHYDPARDVYLAPLIHRNTVLRINYLGPIRRKFNEAVAAGSKALAAGGYTTPNLAGLGVVFVIAPATAVTLVLLALSAVAVVWRLTQAQVERTAAMARIFNDPNTTPEQKIALSKQMQDQAAHEPKPPFSFDVKDLVPIAGLVAVIVLGPRLLELMPRRRVSA